MAQDADARTRSKNKKRKVRYSRSLVSARGSPAPPTQRESQAASSALFPSRAEHEVRDFRVELEIAAVRLGK